MFTHESSVFTQDPCSLLMPLKLKMELKNSTRWDTAAVDQSVVQLLLSIKDTTHNKKEQNKSVVAFIEDIVKLDTIFQGQNETLNDYQKVFKAQGDTINVHSERQGYTWVSTTST